LDINDEQMTHTGLNGNIRDPQADPPTTVSAAIHTIRVRKLWARIQAIMYPQTGIAIPADPSFANMFKLELDQWLAAAPEQLPSNKAHNNAFGSSEWFEISYHHSILLLYRHQLVQDPIDDATWSSVHLSSANSGREICSLYRQLYLSQWLNDTWGALHVLFLGGITFLYCLWTSNDVRKAYRLDKVSSTCTSCIIVLAVMAERCSAIKPYRDAFDMLASATQSMLAGGELMATGAVMPVLSSHGQDQFMSYLSSMSELGMCSSVEQLLNGIF
jgi:hypothetical protein